MSEQERRQFNRILFTAEVDLRAGDKQFQCQLLDLSLKGALLRKPAEFNFDECKEVLLALGLEGMPNRILMHGEIAHGNDETLGICFDLMDIDSVTHLRRLIALNLGDDSLLNRELGALAPN